MPVFPKEPAAVAHPGELPIASHTANAVDAAPAGAGVAVAEPVNVSRSLRQARPLGVDRTSPGPNGVEERSPARAQLSVGSSASARASAEKEKQAPRGRKKKRKQQEEEEVEVRASAEEVHDDEVEEEGGDGDRDNNHRGDAVADADPASTAAAASRKCPSPEDDVEDDEEEGPEVVEGARGSAPLPATTPHKNASSPAHSAHSSKGVPATNPGQPFRFDTSAAMDAIGVCVRVCMCVCVYVLLPCFPLSCRREALFGMQGRRGAAGVELCSGYLWLLHTSFGRATRLCV